MKTYKKSDLKFVHIIEKAENPIFLGYDFVVVEDNGVLCTSVLDPEKEYVFYDIKPGTTRPRGVTFAEHADWSISSDNIYLRRGLFRDKNQSDTISRKDLLRWVRDRHESGELYFLNYQPTEKKGEKTKKYGDKRTITI